jgi:hypothetical protein
MTPFIASCVAMALGAVVVGLVAVVVLMDRSEQ